MTTVIPAIADSEIARPAATAGDIAAINLASARQRSWSRFWRAPRQPQIAELIVEQEQLTAQFFGDLAAFDRLEVLVYELSCVEPESARAELIAAQVACSVHRFEEAREHLGLAIAGGAPTETTTRLSLTLDQATGANLSTVLQARRDLAARRGHWGDRVPLAALLADLGAFEEAHRTYVEALLTYPDVSPFGPAWASFQLGLLWGEAVPVPDRGQAAKWYRTAIDYLPGYVKARVHLAEIYLEDGCLDDATTILAPALESGDPEVSWRLADVALAAGETREAAMHLAAARAGFEDLLAKHPLAFADHGAEFYAGSGDNHARAFELAQLNLRNRPTRRAFDQAYATALAAGADDVAARLRREAIH